MWIQKISSREEKVENKQRKKEEMPIELPPLPYDYSALEPHISKKTLEVHHDKHHAKYGDLIYLFILFLSIITYYIMIND